LDDDKDYDSDTVKDNDDNGRSVGRESLALLEPLPLRHAAV
jgi:hypothetical protein